MRQVMGEHPHLRVLDGRKKQPVVEGQQVHVVCEIQQLFCLLVVWAPIGAVAIGVVLPAILDSVV